MQEANPKTIYLKDYQSPAFLIEQVNLRFVLQEMGTQVFSEMQVRRNPQADKQDGSLLLDGESLRYCWAKIDGELLADDTMQVTDEGLRLFSPPDEFIFSSKVEIAPEKNTALEGLYRSGKLFCTQCEAEGFRKITWFLDRPDVMARFHVRIEADKANYPVLLSNGNPRSSGDLPDGQHFAEWDDPIPKPCYLFALVAGDLHYVQDSHTTPSGRKVDLRIYVEAENINKCGHAMRSLKNAMRWDEENYGREYDLDVYNIVAVNDFNMGAMENKGLNIFNAKYVLARPDTATDSDFQDIEGVIAHEYFHNWTGNRITCRDWFQLSLKEGLTVYRDQAFSADMGSRSVKRIEEVRLLRAHQFAEDASPMAHPIRPASYIEINNFYTVTVYEKGAEVVRMQANLLGPELYRQATDLYFERHDGQAVTTEDFVTCMADASGRDLTQFQHWYSYAGTPQLIVQDTYDAKVQRYSITFKQQVPNTPQQTDKPAFHIPVALGLLDAAGQDIQNLQIELHEAEQTFVFNDIAECPTPSILRGFSAPVKVEYAYTDEQLMHLMAHDSDGFNRWDAGQTLLINTLLQMVRQHQAGQSMQVPDSLPEALRSVLLSQDIEPALVAEIFSLPGVAYVGDFMPVVDMDSIYLAREALRKTIAQTLREDLSTVYESLAEQGKYQITHQAIGKRRLKNVVLGYLLSLQDAETMQLAIDQYMAQHNMTDVMAALALIADTDEPIRNELLAGFAERWQHDPLVMDKWFSVQALSTRENVLGDIQQLMQHPAFSMHNPNKVRALIGAFASNNPLRFHTADGSGYRFIAGQVKVLDKLNPQIAARLLRSLARWQRYDENRQQHARAVLQDVLAGDVSKDVYEIAEKSLILSK